MPDKHLIAVAAEDDRGLESDVSHHFGRCPYYVIVDSEDGRIGPVRVVVNPYFQEHSPGMVPQFIKSQDVTVMIAGGMGPRAKEIFDQNGIEVATGAQGTVRRTLEDYLAGRLSGYDPCSGSEDGHGHGDCH
jgi:predicted Fe-Mo cluster-binding NifX family protein